MEMSKEAEIFGGSPKSLGKLVRIAGPEPAYGMVSALPIIAFLQFCLLVIYYIAVFLQALYGACGQLAVDGDVSD